MPNVKMLALAALVASAFATAPPAQAQTTTLTMSSRVSPQHHLTGVVLQGWANEVEKAANGHVKFLALKDVWAVAVLLLRDGRHLRAASSRQPRARRWARSAP